MDQDQYLNSEPESHEDMPISPLNSPDSVPTTSGAGVMSRKRARTSTTSDEIEEMLGCGEESSSQQCIVKPETGFPKRDDSYYFEDGSFVLQVENTLFNVSMHS